MSTEILLTSVARVKTRESDEARVERQLMPPLESDIDTSWLPEPSDEELDAVLSGEKSHDGGDHSDADTQHRIEHVEPFFRVCAWFGLHAAATSTAPLNMWKKAHGIVMLALLGACGIRTAFLARQAVLSSAIRTNMFFLSAYFFTTIPAFALKLRIFWSRPQLHRSFSLLLDPAHDVLMHSTRIHFTNRAWSISSQKMFHFFLASQIGICISTFYSYIKQWSALAEFQGAFGLSLALIFDSFITPYLTQCIVCEFSFVQFVCDSHVFAVKRLEALFVSSRLARALETGILNLHLEASMGK